MLNHHRARPFSESCLLYLRTCKTFDQLKQIQTQILMADLHQARGPANKLIAFCADPSLGNLAHAQKVLDFLRQPTLFAYNVTIKAYTKQGFFERAIDIFERLREEDALFPDSFTFPFVLKSLACLGRLFEGKKIHGFVVKLGFDSDLYVRNSLIDMYGLLGESELAEKLFDETSDRDSVSWNVTISANVRCGRFSEALDLFRLMRGGDNARPSEATVVSTLTACAALRDLNLGAEIHGYVRNELGFTVRIGVALLDMYAKCGCLSVAREIFDGLPSSVVSLTCMVSGYVNHGKLEKARDLFESNPVEDVFVWTVMINGYIRHDRFDKAMSLLREMQRRRIKADKYTLVALLTGCAQHNALDQGEQIVNHINEQRIKLDTVLGTAIIEMYAKCGSIEKSLEVFDAIAEKDTTTWTSIISGLAMNSKSHKAIELFSEMKRAGLIPDDITFIGVLSACSHAGLVEKGREFFYSMTEVHNIEPKLEHYGCLIDLLGRAGLLNEAEEVIEKIPNVVSEFAIPLYSALLSACSVHGNVELGERVAGRLAGVKTCDSSGHVLMANMYASRARWEEMTKVKEDMKICGIKKICGVSSIEINAIE